MQGLAAEEQARLFERFGKRFAAGQSIYEVDQPAPACFLVQEGRVRLVKKVRGMERSLTILHPGDLFGEEALVEPAIRVSSAIAQSDVAVLALERKTFGALMSSNAAAATRLVEQIVRRLRDVEEQLENTMLADAPSRVVHTLIHLAVAAPPGSEGGASIPVSPLELAGRTALDVDAVKRAVQQLRDGGHIRIVDERIVVPDLEALRRLLVMLEAKEKVRGDDGHN